jgi:hypothetical protein
VLPNALALALDSQGRQAGNAAAGLGALQFGLSAVASSAVAALTDDSALPVGRAHGGGCGHAPGARRGWSTWRRKSSAVAGCTPIGT